MSKSEKAQATVLIIGILLFGVAIGKSIPSNQDPEITPIQTQTPVPALTMPSGEDNEDGEEEDDE
jgi:hypothetical protein